MNMQYGRNEFFCLPHIPDENKNLTSTNKIICVENTYLKIPESHLLVSGIIIINESTFSDS